MMTSYQRQLLLVISCLLTTAIVGCGSSHSASSGSSKSPTPGKKTEYRFALIAKSQANPVFQSARTGAEDAAEELSKKLGMKIKVVWQTPNEEDAKLQADYIEQLVLQGIDGIGISCSIADVVTPSINKAVEQGVPVLCFDSDAPKSKRFCYHGTDDVDCGKTIMAELAKILGPGKHVVAIPGGNQNAANIQARIRGAREEAQKYPNIEIRGVYYSKEIPQDAAAKIEEVQTANPDIDGWAMIGSWSLFTDALMKWEPGKVKIVAMDALPAELPYLQKGVVANLYAQQTYGWGQRAIELLADKVIHGKDPKDIFDISPLVPVTKENAEQFGENWKKWLRQ